MIEQEKPCVRRMTAAHAALRSLAQAAMLGVLVSLSGCFGCGGGRELCVQLDRPATFEYPVYIATYYVTDLALLDDVDNKELIDKFEDVKTREGVLLADLRPAYPGGSESACQKDYDKKVAGVVLVANFKKSGACARYKTSIKEGQTLHIQASVVEECLEVTVKD